MLALFSRGRSFGSGQSQRIFEDSSAATSSYHPELSRSMSTENWRGAKKSTEIAENVEGARGVVKKWGEGEGGEEGAWRKTAGSVNTTSQRSCEFTRHYLSSLSARYYPLFTNSLGHFVT